MAQVQPTPTLVPAEFAGQATAVQVSEPPPSVPATQVYAPEPAGVYPLLHVWVQVPSVTKLAHCVP